jgi:hypothetical protein
VPRDVKKIRRDKVPTIRSHVTKDTQFNSNNIYYIIRRELTKETSNVL